MMTTAFETGPGTTNNKDKAEQNGDDEQLAGGWGWNWGTMGGCSRRAARLDRFTNRSRAGTHDRHGISDYLSAIAVWGLSLLSRSELFSPILCDRTSSSTFERRHPIFDIGFPCRKPVANSFL